MGLPRPPQLEEVEWRIRVVHEGATIVDAPRVFRVLETSQPPVYYVDPTFVAFEHLVPIAHNSFCEWKGLAFYAQLMDECWVDDEQVAANPGSFYGGWITSNVTGPFKGVPGSSHW